MAWHIWFEWQTTSNKIIGCEEVNYFNSNECVIEFMPIEQLYVRNSELHAYRIEIGVLCEGAKESKTLCIWMNGSEYRVSLCFSCVHLFD